MQKTCASVPSNQDGFMTYTTQAGKGQGVVRSGENEWMKWCDAVSLCRVLDLLSPTSTLTFYSIGGKAKGALITFTKTALLTLLGHGVSRNPLYARNMCSVGLHYTQRLYLTLPWKGHLALLHCIALTYMAVLYMYKLWNGVALCLQSFLYPSIELSSCLSHNVNCC